MELTEFLLARIAEDEATARAAEPGPWVVGTTTEPVWAPHRGEHWGETVLTREGVFPQTVTVRGTHVASKSAKPRMVADMARGYPNSRYESTSEHIARWDPAHVLAECAAKRRIVEYFSFGVLTEENGHARTALRLLALPYSDHPDYDPEWSPSAAAASGG